MDPDPYKPPGAEVSDPPPRPHSLMRAVITGVAIDMIGTLMLSLALSMGYGLLLGTHGYSADEVKDILTSPDPFSTFGLLAAALGGAVSVFASYATTAIAGRRSYKPAAIVAAISVGFGLIMGSRAYDAGALAFFSILSVACYFVGAFIYVRDPS